MSAVDAINTSDAHTVTAVRVAAVHAWRLLGAGGHEWAVALVAAVLAAAVYDLTMAALRRVTLRIPFLVLWPARLLMPKAVWEVEYREWKAELWEILHEKDRSWLKRLAKGTWWSVTVVLRARQTAQADKRAPKVRARRISEWRISSDPEAEGHALFLGLLTAALAVWAIWLPGDLRLIAIIGAVVGVVALPFMPRGAGRVSAQWRTGRDRAVFMRMSFMGVTLEFATRRTVHDDSDEPPGTGVT